jgi:hypothetical protein
MNVLIYYNNLIYIYLIYIAIDQCYIIYYRFIA